MRWRIWEIITPKSIELAPIWLLGTGRSGTTWLSELLNYRQDYREIFEPFHPYHVKRLRSFALYEYVPPSCANDDKKDKSLSTLYRFMNRVFNGQFFDIDCDLNTTQNNYSGLLVKDIFSLLFANWYFLKKPDLKIVYLLRNPFAAAYSTFRARDWIWLEDPLELLNQPKLLNDYLRPHVEYIEDVCAKNDFILNQVLIWSIVNGIALDSLKSSKVKYVFYENLQKDTQSTVNGILDFCGNVEVDRKLLEDIVSRNLPSKTSGLSITRVNDEGKKLTWKEQLTTCQVEGGKQILDHFGLGVLYANDEQPNIDLVSNYSFPR